MWRTSLEISDDTVAISEGRRGGLGGPMSRGTGEVSKEPWGMLGGIGGHRGGIWGHYGGIGGHWGVLGDVEGR
jgi:hypothetical protein